MGGAYLLHPSCPMARGDLSNPLPPWWCLHADTLNKKLTLLVKEMREYVLHSLELFSPLPSFYLPLTTPALAFPYHFLLSIWRSIFYRVCISKCLDSQRGKKKSTQFERKFIQQSEAQDSMLQTQTVATDQKGVVCVRRCWYQPIGFCIA